MNNNFIVQYVSRIPSTFESAVSFIAAVLAMFFIISLLVLMWVLVHHQIERKCDSEMNLYCEREAQTLDALARQSLEGTNALAGQNEDLNGDTTAAQGARHTCPYRDAPADEADDCYNPRRGAASFIGHPALLDHITRLIRHTCPQSWAHQNGKCGLCSQEIGVNYIIRTLPCGHSFHNLCILRWLVLLRHMRCPDCNQGITS